MFTAASLALVCLLLGPVPTQSDLAAQLLRAVEADDAKGVAAALDQGADPNTFKKFRVSALMIAAEKGNLAAVRALLEAGAWATATTSYGQTPLHFAALGGNAEIVRVLLAAGGEPNARARFGMRPLHIAAGTGSVAAVEALLAGKADPNLSNASGETALHVAARAGKLEVVERLLAGGARPDLTDGAGDDPRLAALGQGQAKTAERLAEALRAAGLPVREPAPARTTFAHLSEVDWENRTYQLGSCQAELRLGKSKVVEGPCAVSGIEVLLWGHGGADELAAILLHRGSVATRSDTVAIVYDLHEKAPRELGRVPAVGARGLDVTAARWVEGVLELTVVESGAPRTTRWRREGGSLVPGGP